MSAFDHKHYIPILKGKAGEFAALKELPTEVKTSITPLIEVLPFDFSETDPSSLKKLVSKVKNAWQMDTPIFADLYLTEIEDEPNDGKHILVPFYREALENSLSIIPVTGIFRTPDYELAIKNIINEFECELCLRLEYEDFESNNIAQNIENLLGKLNLDPSIVHLIIDWKATAIPGIALIPLLQTIPYLKQWKTFAIAYGSFPESMADVKAGIDKKQRKEWAQWKHIYSKYSDKVIDRMPTYGDYGVSSPYLPDFDPVKMRMSAKIKYTIDNEWLILKGGDVARHGYEQFFALCKNLIEQEEFKGSDFSWGDNFIYQCAMKQEKTGNMTTWVQVGTNHHLALVVNQISSLL